MVSRVKILQINVVYGIKSTGLICRDIENTLDNETYEFHMAYSLRGNIAPKRGYVIGSRIDRKFHALSSRITGLQGYSSTRSTLKLVNYIKFHDIKIVHLHNLHSNNLNLNILFSHLADNNISTIFTLHDCWPYTGKCMHYESYACEKWKDICSGCPQLREGNPSWYFDMTSKMLSDKQNMYRRLDKLAVIGVSDWITNEAKQSIMKDAKIIRRIYNWVDVDLFRPRNSKDSTRAKIGISSKEFIVLSVASKWTDRKGISFLVECASALYKEARFIIVGKVDKEIKLPDNCLNIAETHNLEWLACLYDSADVFFNPSIEETFGKVTAEAMASGTPVIVLNGTANPELVADGCGYIISSKNENLVVKAIRTIKTNTKEFYRECCREHAIQNFNKFSVMSQYRDFYAEVAAW